MMKLSPHISTDPHICHGKPVIDGTRVLVSVVVGGLAGGMSMDDIAREYEVTHEQIRGALEYATSLVAREQYHPLPA